MRPIARTSVGGSDRPPRPIETGSCGKSDNAERQERPDESAAARDRLSSHDGRGVAQPRRRPVAVAGKTQRNTEHRHGNNADDENPRPALDEAVAHAKTVAISFGHAASSLVREL